LLFSKYLESIRNPQGKYGVRKRMGKKGKKEKKKKKRGESLP
jgi:hypothetical protein